MHMRNPFYSPIEKSVQVVVVLLQYRWELTMYMQDHVLYATCHYIRGYTSIQATVLRQDRQELYGAIWVQEHPAGNKVKFERQRIKGH